MDKLSRFEVPVTLVLFNRPEKTEILLKEIQKIKPQTLFVIADGPRKNKPADFQKCEVVRQLVDKYVDWDVNLHKIYADENMSAPVRIPSGLDEVFAQVEETIILEDDCIPHPSFFYFCQELLHKFRDDDRVSLIGGYNLYFDFWGKPATPPGDSSFFYSYIPSIWGWATWKRTWDIFEHEVKGVDEFIQKNKAKSIFKDLWSRKFLNQLFLKLKKKDRNEWGYRMLYTLNKRSKLSVVPRVNLVQNVGFDKDGTNLKADMYPSSKLASEMTFPLTYPEEVTNCEKYTERVGKHFFTASKLYKLFYVIRNYKWRLEKK